MSRDIWVTSDTHFGHENIIKYCNRPFDNAKEMDEHILTKWNETVKDGDIVYHLGDVCFRGYDIIKKLKGRKRLIVGNHDDIMKVGQHFQKVMMWRMFPEFDLVLTHVPIDLGFDDNSHRKYNYNVHGHIHNAPNPKSPKHMNVCVEMTNYTPVNIEELRKK